MVRRCRTREATIAPYKYPRAIEFVPLPRTETGKLQRFRLRQMAPAREDDEQRVWRRCAAGWTPPKGYANGIAARGTMVFVGGQIGWNGSSSSSRRLRAQARQALQRRRVLRRPARARAHRADDLVRRRQARVLASYRALGAAYREVIGRHFPAMTAVQVPR